MKIRRLNNAKNKMCRRKLSYRSLKSAIAAAEKYGHDVYECPLCFCFHTTGSGINSEFIMRDQAEAMVRRKEAEIRTEMNKKLKEKNSQIFDLQRQLKQQK